MVSSRAADTPPPMRRASREITERSAIDAVIRADRVMHLALVDGDRPFIVPVFYGYDGKSLYFHSASAGRKIEVLKANAAVSFEISVDHGVITADQACDFEARHRTVIGFGHAVFLVEEAEKVRALDLIVAQFSDRKFDYPKAKLGITSVVRIDIDWLKGKSYGADRHQDG